MKTTRIAASLVAALGFFGTIAQAATAEDELLLSGPVESIDRAAGSITVLGHTLIVRDVSSMLPGHVVNVFGRLQANGSAKAAMVQNTEAFAASGDLVSVTGVVRSIDRSTGQVNVDGATVDYTALLGNVRFTLPSVGDTVRILGSQPNGRGLVLANQIALVLGVSNGGNALGVSNGGNALGVSNGGSALGVSNGGSALGVSNGGSALGVSNGGSALGVSNGGSALGVSNGGSALGVSNGGSALGVSNGGSALGVSNGGSALGVSNGGSAMGVSNGGSALGVSNGGSALGVSNGGSALGVSNGGYALGSSGGPYAR